MSFIPPRHPNTRPRSEAGEPRDAGAREFVADWLGHVEAGRIGGNPPMSEEVRAVVLANELLICGRLRSPTS
jgi:hypothetical protein